MPFDGCQMSQELLVLGVLIDFFAGEDRWVRGEFKDDQGRACLVGICALRGTIRQTPLGRCL